ESGGLLSESKNDILKLIPDHLTPDTIFCSYPASFDQVMESMAGKGMYFPVIGKPDHGERGWMVEKIGSKSELQKYISRIRTDFLIQEFIDLPHEAGIFYCRFPNREKGYVTSVVIKELLKITGNGVSTVREIIRQVPRASLQLRALEKRIPDQMNLVPLKGEVIELVPIGNHSRGTTFLNGNHLIDERMNHVFNTIAAQIHGFYYGRFDIRYASPEDLYTGTNIRILELNGAKSEPAHIYHPGYPILKAYKDLFRHWKILYGISVLNRKSGIRYPGFRNGWKAWKKFRQFQRLRDT
ncbi:MAG TPA: hypothetical protein VI583_11165, partial [Cyclobacteriaceae bacterium]|nr:hypothetical protein [Cyclobacteriaceae bacterium]